MLVWKEGKRTGRGAARFAGLASAALQAALALLAAGCASPGPPKAPSLQLPEMVTKLEATRRAGVVELEFPTPTRTTDGLAYRGTNIRMRVCRAVEAGACVPVPSLTCVTAAAGTAWVASGATEWKTKLKDVLPDALASGTPRLLTYRVELSNEKGRTAGFGNAAFAAAGAAPAGVAGLRAEGSRGGVAVRWQPNSGMGDVVLRRELVGGVPETVAKGGKTRQAVTGNGKHGGRGQTGRAKPAKSSQGDAKERAGVVWLSTVPEADPLAVAAEQPAPATKAAVNSANGVLDDGAAIGGTYRYAAERRETVQLGGHTLVLRGELSAPVEVTLRAEYPPPDADGAGGDGVSAAGWCGNRRGPDLDPGRRSGDGRVQGLARSRWGSDSAD